MPHSSNLLSFNSAPHPEPRPRSNLLDSIPQPELEIGTGSDPALGRIAAAALSATGAAGAALALRSDEFVVCMARAGEMAPPLGAQLDDESGMSGACLRSGQALRCDDTETDSRVDAEACRFLGLRSLAVAPVRDGERIIGILEVFSPEPKAFSERHLEFLTQLADLAVAPQKADLTGKRSPTESAAATYLPEVSTPPQGAAVEAAASTAREQFAPATQLPGDVNIAAYMAAHAKAQSHTKPRVPTIVLVGLAVLVIAVLSGWYLGHREQQRAATSPDRSIATSASITPVPVADSNVSGAIAESAITETQPKNLLTENKPEPEAVRGPLKNAASLDRIPNSSHSSSKPLRVVRNEPLLKSETEVAPNLTFSPVEGRSKETISSLLNTPATLPQRMPPISQGVEGGDLVTRVPAIYPPQARAVGQHGTVVLEALVAEDGTVRDVKVISGPPLLRQAAADAVRRWHYRPYRLNGKPIAAQTQVKLEFKLQ